MIDQPLNPAEVAGIVFDVKRFAIHDGPGVRTTVFVKGCPLRCVWCHNPHSQQLRKEVSYQAELCQYCRQCAQTCEHNAHTVTDGQHEYDRDACVLCGECMDGCIPGALTFIGCEMTVAEVIGEVLKDKNYYKTSGGGMTVSGGEPMAQFAFTRALLQSAKNENLHTILDTCGQASFDKYADVMPYVDLVHYDIKETDTALHEKYTGFGNELILENLRRIDQLGKPIILRCPIVPGLNDRDDHLAKLGHLAEQCNNVAAIHVLAFHPYGSTHARKVGMAFELESIPAVNDDQANQWVDQVAKAAAVPVTRG